MSLPDISTVKSADEARDLAIDWQHETADDVMYWSDVAEYGAYFTELADKYPELREEFTENGII